MLFDNEVVMWFRNEVDPIIMMLFGPGELTTKRITEEADTGRNEYEPDDDGLITIHELRASISAVRDRLNVLGFGRNCVVQMFDQLLSERLQSNLQMTEHFGASNAALSAERDRELTLLRSLTFEEWCRRVRQSDFEDGPEFALAGTRTWFYGLWEETDPRYIVRALIEALPNTSEIAVDVTALTEGGWLDLDNDPRESAFREYAVEASIGWPVVVLTEGISDTRVLKGALQVLKPHLDGFLRFPDFSTRPESNSSALVKTIKSFVSAGVPNRIVAVFDNDTAAHEALRSLSVGSLPQNFYVLTLPQIPLASEYPTLGPNGPSIMDVNGLAVSIELYLGVDTLKNEIGELRPVQWRGYSDALQRYQGEITGKREVQQAFAAKLEAAESDPTIIASQDWSGLTAVLDHILSALASGPSPHLPLRRAD